MCTLVAALGQFPGFPLVVAANRDERLDRASSPPRVWPGGFVAPRDEVAGGTWLGVTRGGMFVGLTNRFGVPADRAKRSRGEIVVRALAAPSARALHQTMAAFPGADYNPFHLLYADARDAFVTWHDGARLSQAELGRGVHVVTERSLGGDDKARTERVREHWRKMDSSRPPDVALLQDLLRLHGEDDPVGGTCIHLPAFNYGTRSSLVFLEAERPGDSRFLWAEGAPCQAPFEDLSPLLARAA